MGHYDRGRLQEALNGGELILFLTGAGLSVASGVPDFRHDSTWWTCDGVKIPPAEMATRKMFERDPRPVWSWYLYRRAVVHASNPNPAHQSLAVLEQRLGDRFLLLTQNVDGLHLRAGNSRQRTFEIHGNLDYHRCLGGCCEPLYLAEDLLNPGADLISPETFQRLRCPRCQGRTRPHVLWFDEYYDEEWFRYDSSLEAARRAGVLVVVGSSGQTRLPRQVAELAGRQAFLINVDPEENVFGQFARSGAGVHLREPATSALPRLAQLIGASEEPRA